MAGLRLAALYSLRPHELYLCGPKEAAQQKTLRRFLKGEISAAKLRTVLRKFVGAYQYYRLIAKSNKIEDSFVEEVVRAYWIGNELLGRVKINKLRQMIVGKFSGPKLLAKKSAIKKAQTIPENSKPHHSFHVLFVGSVAGSVDFKNTKLKDLCRVGWGKVKKLKVESRKLKVIVEHQPLVGKKEIKLGEAIRKEIIWDKEIAPEIKTGDWVSFHWGQIVQVLTLKDVANLKKHTLNTLKSLYGK